MQGIREEVGCRCRTEGPACVPSFFPLGPLETSTLSHQLCSVPSLLPQQVLTQENKSRPQPATFRAAKLLGRFNISQ